ncbi:MAG: class I SAM-dependent methyltransferase [Nanoarchaeota archaeon]
MIKKIISDFLILFNLKVNWIYKKSQRDFSNAFFPRPSTMFVLLNNKKKKKLIGVEIGVFLGNNAESMLKTIPIKKLYLVDPYSMTGYKEYSTSILSKTEKISHKKLFKYKDKIKFIKMNSVDAARCLPNDLDFVYIDGNHDYEFVKKDMEIYYKKLKIGGVLSGHDVDNANKEAFKGPLKAFLEFANKKKLEIYIHSPDWWVIKK